MSFGVCFVSLFSCAMMDETVTNQYSMVANRCCPKE